MAHKHTKHTKHTHTHRQKKKKRILRAHKYRQKKRPCLTYPRPTHSHSDTKRGQGGQTTPTHPQRQPSTYFFLPLTTARYDCPKCREEPPSWELVERWLDDMTAVPFETDAVALGADSPTPPPLPPGGAAVSTPSAAAILATLLSSMPMRASSRAARSSCSLSDSRHVSRKLCAVVVVMSSRSCLTCSTVVPILASRGKTCARERIIFCSFGLCVVSCGDVVCVGLCWMPFRV